MLFCKIIPFMAIKVGKTPVGSGRMPVRVNLSANIDIYLICDKKNADKKKVPGIFVSFIFN